MIWGLLNKHLTACRLKEFWKIPEIPQDNIFYENLIQINPQILDLMGTNTKMYVDIFQEFSAFPETF